MLIAALSERLHLPEEYLLRVAKSANHLYKTYRVAKRNGGTREIHHPSRELKALQRALADYIIAALPVHAAATAYRRGSGILNNAEPHVRQAFLLRLDISDFFPSLTREHIEEYIGSNPNDFVGWADADRDFFCRLVCRGGCLTIGAPTSPGLSNVLCRPLDVALADMSDVRRVAYTRYADDMFFSSSQPNVLRDVEQRAKQIVHDLRSPNGLRINDKKTLHTSRKRRREVTGLVLTPNSQVSLGRQRKRFIRSLLHQYGSLEEERKATLAGLLSFAISIEPEFVNRLVVKYGPEAVTTAMRPPR